MCWKKSYATFSKRRRVMRPNSARQQRGDWRKRSMKGESSVVPTSKLEAQLRLLHLADEGQLDRLPCPQCAENAVCVCFTRRSDNDYWTWFVCNRCGFESRAQGGRPRHYSPERERGIGP